MEYLLQIIFSNGEMMLGRAKKTVDSAMRDLNTVGALRTYSVLAHRYVCSLAKVVPHAKLRSFTLLFYISANGSLVYPVLYMSIFHFLS